MGIRENPYEYSVFIDAPSKEALIAVREGLNFEARFGEYCKPEIVRKIDFPALGGQGYLLVIYSSYKLGAEYKSSWIKYQHIARWFLKGFAAGRNQ